MKFFTGYENIDVKAPERGFRCVGDSLTVQADAADADINVIMDRYARTGQVPGLSRLPRYGDFDGITDYRDAIHAVRDADDLFMQLPAKVRSRFDNDAAAFVEFCEKPENRLELAELGLLSPEVTDAIRKEAAQVKENPTDGRTDKGGAVAASGRQPGRPSAASGAGEGGAD